MTTIERILQRKAGEPLDLRGANLTKANLQGVDLQGANLNEANLQGANLQWANLGWADLRGAGLYDANLTEANLTKANLQGANLQWANLQGANLYGANLQGANLQGAKGIRVFGPGGSRGDMTYAVRHEAGWMVKAGCFWGTPDELATAAETTHGDSEHGRFYRAVCTFLATT